MEYGVLGQPRQLGLLGQQPEPGLLGRRATNRQVWRHGGDRYDPAYQQRQAEHKQAMHDLLFASPAADYVNALPAMPEGEYGWSDYPVSETLRWAIGKPPLSAEQREAFDDMERPMTLAETAQFAGEFAPGAGFADYMGWGASGGPSFTENVQSGDYVAAGMQTADAGADLLSTIAPWATVPAMFLGVGAKTADLAKFRKAERMKADGAGRQEIWDETGWFEGADGKWRFEIDDSGAAMSVEPPTQGIRAYHGSPHDFDAFDMSAIGTGEGAQAYGHGLYFAESEGVARSYKDNLSSFRIKMPSGEILGGDTIGNHESIMDALEKELEMVGADLKWGSSGLGGFDLEDAIEPWYGSRGTIKFEDLPKILRDPDNISAASDGNYGVWTAEEKARYRRERLQAADDIEKLIDAGLSEIPGRMYEVNINASPDEFLDWDAPLSEQPDALREYVRRADLSHLPEGGRLRRTIEAHRQNPGDWSPAPGANIPEPTGNQIHSALTDYGNNAADNAALSSAMSEAGIKGVRYKDAGSRGKDGDGTSNYVVFDDKIISIVRKYGIPGLIAAGYTMEQAAQMFPEEYAKHQSEGVY